MDAQSVRRNAPAWPGSGLLRSIADLWWFLRLVSRASPLFFKLVLLISLAGGLMVPAQLVLTKRVVNAITIQTGDSEKTLVLLLAVLVVVLLLERALSSVTPLVQARVREEAGSNLQEKTMLKTCSLDLIVFEDQSYYDQLNRVTSELESRCSQIASNLSNLIRAIPRLSGYVVVLCSLSPLLLLVGLIAVVPALISFVVGGQNAWSLLLAQTRDRRLGEYYQQLLIDRSYAKEIRLYGLSDYLTGKWSALFWKNRNQQRKLALKLAFKQRLRVFLATAANLFGLWWVVTFGLTQATPGEYALLFQSLNGLFGIIGLAGSFRQIGNNCGYASQLREFFELPTLQPSSETDGRLPGESASRSQSPNIPFPRPLKEEIRFENVSFSYPGSARFSLTDVSFSISAGEKIAIVGENGAGKTTLVKLLSGLYTLDEGRITFDGHDLREIDRHSLYKATSAVFQNFVHYPLTLRENIALGQVEHIDDTPRVLRAIEQAGIAHITGRLPAGYDTIIGPDLGGTDLSGGEWQRVAIARSFFRSAEILILDEPTAALDPLSELALFEHFIKLTDERTAILISHRLGMARLADRILVLKDGRLVEEGTHDELVRRDGEYARLFQAQARWYQ